MQVLDDIQMDTLREVGNIGAGHAMTALATLVDHRVDMNIPKVGVVELTEFARMAGGEEAISVGIYMPVQGDAPGHVAFIMPESNGRELADHLLGRAPGETTTLQELECSALMEVGNILASSYLVALGDMTGLQMLSSPPAIAVDYTASILSTVACAVMAETDRALTIVTQIGETREPVEGYFIYIPDSGSLPILLHALGMEA